MGGSGAAAGVGGLVGWGFAVVEEVGDLGGGHFYFLFFGGGDGWRGGEGRGGGFDGLREISERGIDAS